MTNTWRELRERIGGDQGVLEEIRRLTAPERAMTRRQQAEAAAVRWVRDRGPLDMATARALCAAEARGLYGGGLRDPGAGTQRHEAFRGLGSGRRQAGDGAAWTAAIRDASVGEDVPGSQDIRSAWWVVLPQCDPAFPPGVYYSGVPVRLLLSREELLVLYRGLIRRPPWGRVGPDPTPYPHGGDSEFLATSAEWAVALAPTWPGSDGRITLGWQQDR